MPGFGMGLSMQQRLSQRLEQKLLHTLSLSMAMVQSFHTTGEGGAEEQNIILEKLLQDVKHSVYSDWENFHYRCMKRIKTDDRSENVKLLIGAIRGIVEHTQPSLDEVKTILEVGMHARRKNEIPNVVYMHMDDTLRTEAAQGLEDRVELIRIGDTLQKKNASVTAAYEFLHRTAEKEKFSGQEQYTAVVSGVSRLARDKADVIRFANNYFSINFSIFFKA